MSGLVFGQTEAKELRLEDVELLGTGQGARGETFYTMMSL